MGLTYGANNYMNYGQDCTCDNSDTCSVPAGFYNDSLVDTQTVIRSSLDTTNVSFVMNNWFVGCWALGSLLLSSVEGSFLNNQTALELIATYSNWSSNSILPNVLNLNASKQANESSRTFNDLLQNLFVESLLTEVNYSLYFTQCQPQSCFYLIKQHSSPLYICTSLVALYGGLSVVLQFLIPYVVAFLIKRFGHRIEASVDTEVLEMKPSWWQRIQTMAEFLWSSLVELNMFKSSVQQEPSDIKEQRWTTRIFILCLALALVILIFYSMLKVQIKSIEVDKPSLDTVLYLKLQSESSSSLRCPCTQINSPYENFVQLQPSYHQVCSSPFVSAAWWNNVRDLIQAPIDNTRSQPDFRYTYQLFFLLQTLCTITNRTIFNSLETFKQSQLVTGDLLFVDIFNYQMNSTIEQFKSGLATTFLSCFHLIRNITYVNQIFAYLNNAHYTLIGSPLNAVTFSISNYSGESDNSLYTCSCANDINCRTTVGLYSAQYYVTPKFVVPGLYKACFPLESLLHSTLECFYDNQDCLTTVINFYNVTWFQPQYRLNSSIPSRFSTNSSMNTLLSELFIENWIQLLNYSSHFSQCQPASCFYKISRRNNLLETITTIVGLIGGLSVSLRIGVPFVVTVCFAFIRRRRRQRVPTEPISVLARLVTLVTRIRHWLQKLNVFDNPNKNTPNYIKQQQRATYVYFILLSIALFILVVYNSLAYSTTTFTVMSPSVEQYQQLEQQYSEDTINCPCSQLSTPYSSFIDFECDFHPVCTSQFISQAYLQQLFLIYNSLDTQYAPENAFTLQGTIFSHLQALLSLCNLAKDAVNDARHNYLTSSLISASLIDYDLFERQINTSLAQFKSTLADQYLNNLQLIRGITQSNAFVSLYSTNWYPVLNNLNFLSTVYMRPQYYGNCTCLTSAACAQSSTPFIQGYLVGCTPLEALLRSSIECMYEQACVNLLTAYLNLSLPAPAPLNQSETRFALTDTVDSIVQQMFIETCSSNVSYNQFFEQCRPLSCSVTIIRRNGLVIVITVLLCLYGGLTTFLKLAVPLLVFSMHRLVRRCKQRLVIQVHPRQV